METISKHRMLLFITWFLLVLYMSLPISKHRMLLFIGFVHKIRGICNAFQNIVCYCLSGQRNDINDLYDNFKTSYVTVYRVVQAIVSLFCPFQNIVCYCLSTTAGMAVVAIKDFKTSYVTVYLYEWLCYRYEYGISKHRILLFICSAAFISLVAYIFQNIVCYCLSCNVLRYSDVNITISKHRMLLFIYTVHIPRIGKVNFKTSYVTVYQSASDTPCKVLFISKHRMLLFIHHRTVLHRRYFYFKTSYVTVYHFRCSRYVCHDRISKHRMLLFITLLSIRCQIFCEISKHRMLLFI